MEHTTNGLIKDESQQNKTPLHMLLAKKTKRMFGAIIDMCIVALSGMILSGLVAVPLTDFKAMSEQATAQIDVMSESALATHLYKLDESEQPIKDDAMFTAYLAAKLSSDSEVFIRDDALLFYYVEHQQQTMAYFNQEILGLPQELEGENTSPFWQYSATIDDAAIFKSEVKERLSAAQSGSAQAFNYCSMASSTTFRAQSTSLIKKAIIAMVANTSVNRMKNYL